MDKNKIGEHAMHVGLPIAALVLLTDVFFAVSRGEMSNALLHIGALAGVLGGLEYVWVGKR